MKQNRSLFIAQSLSDSPGHNTSDCMMNLDQCRHHAEKPLGVADVHTDGLSTVRASWLRMYREADPTRSP